jgi:transcriptional regulator with PAS, ATPase and Fis domain
MNKNTYDLNNMLKMGLEALQYVIMTDENGYIVYITDKYAKFFNIDAEKAIGQYVKNVIPNSRMHIVANTGIEDVGQAFRINDIATVVCNRIPIRDSYNKVVGVISTPTFRDLDKIEILNNEIEKLKNENKFYRKELSDLRESKYSLNQVVGESNPIIRIKDTIQEIADSSLSVLITGETGTGKEVFANAIHQISRRRSNNFVKINCAAIPKDLLESELFGYEEGAFSGASKGGKLGKFELANKGTILLDEIGELPLSLQSKLLRVIQEKEVERVGGLKPLKIDVRILCNTNKNIEELVEKGLFREDLYYRINVVELQIPALRERISDIPLLCKFLINKINNENHSSITGISNDVINILKQHKWPGNIRELEHTLERACVVAKSGELKINHFDFLILRMLKNSSVNLHSPLTEINPNEIIPLEEKRILAEKEEIIKALITSNGNKTIAAKMLGIDRTILYGKMKKYQISKWDSA